jgi:hypothetical protein
VRTGGSVDAVGEAEAAAVADAVIDDVADAVNDAAADAEPVAEPVAVAVSATHAVRLSVLTVPDGQGAQIAEPAAAAARPAAQGVHAAASDAPATAFAVPAPQGTHSSSVLYVPGGQGGPHVGEPAGVSAPGGHAEHEPFAGCDAVPAGHCVGYGKQGPAGHA